MKYGIVVERVGTGLKNDDCVNSMNATLRFIDMGKGSFSFNLSILKDAFGLSL